MEEPRLMLKVEGMTCNHCASTVTGIIQQEGGKDIHVDYLMGEASFELDQAEKIKKILDRLSTAGYTSHTDGAQENFQKSTWSDIEKKFAFTLPFSLVLFSHMLLSHDSWLHDPWIQLALCLPVFGLGFYHFGKSTNEAAKSGNINMDILILLGSSSAFGYSLYGTIMHSGTNEVQKFLFYETTSTIITLVLLGYVIEHRAVQKTTIALKALFKSKPEKAKKLVQNGLLQDLEITESATLLPGDIILVNAGDRVPADGTIIHGELRLDEAMLTGESEAILKKSGNEVLSGSLVLDGNGTLRVTKAGKDSTISQIIELVKQSRSDKPSVQKLADRISSVFVPAIVGIAALTFLVNHWGFQIEFSKALERSIAVLVIACPCAMGLATPTAVSVGLGIAAKLGIIVKRASVFEEISALKVLVFDKTGTLTTGNIDVVLDDVAPYFSQEDAWSIVAALEKRSNHPLASSIQTTTKGLSPAVLDDIREVKGSGMQGIWNGKKILFGSPDFTSSNHSNADLVLLVDREEVAWFRVTDQLKTSANTAINHLKNDGKQVVILSGDSASKTTSVANTLGVKDFKWRQKPEEKLEYISQVKQTNKVGMVGDGINDAPSLAKADVGISIGNTNALAAESAKVVILSGNLDHLVRMFKISKGVVRTIRQNLFWAFAYNLIAIPMAAAGNLDPMLAALSMAFSDVVVIGNSLRLRFILPKQSI